MSIHHSEAQNILTLVFINAARRDEKAVAIAELLHHIGVVEKQTAFLRRRYVSDTSVFHGDDSRSQNFAGILAQTWDLKNDNLSIVPSLHSRGSVVSPGRSDHSSSFVKRRLSRLSAMDGSKIVCVAHERTVQGNFNDLFASDAVWDAVAFSSDIAREVEDFKRGDAVVFQFSSFASYLSWRCLEPKLNDSNSDVRVNAQMLKLEGFA